MADIGILNNYEGGEEERPRVSSRFDVYNALTSAEHRGGCYSSDGADGTTTSPALPSLLGLHINGVGKISLPLSDDNNKAIKSKAQLIDDDKYNNIFQIESDNVTIKNPAYDVALQKLVKHVAYKLGVNPSNISANLEMLMYMEKGSRINEERDEEEVGGVFGTLLVQLPSSFTGGGFSFIREGEEDGSCTTFSMGGGDSGDAEFALHYLCQYSACQYAMQGMESGSRIVLKYSLRYESDEQHTLAMLRSSMLPLEQSMAFLPPLERIVLIPLLKEYDVSSLLMNGINELSYEHRANAEAIKAARKGDWKVLIVNAKMVHSYSDSYNTMGSFTTKTTILHMIDEEGNDVTKSMEWLEDTINFDSIVTGNTGNQMGMMLSIRQEAADPYDDYNDEYGPPCHFPNEWGEATKKDTVSCCCYHGRSECREHQYDDDSSTYTASFILAYDQASAEPELICLSGLKGVTTISERVVSTEDYDLLERMLSVVETNKKSKLDKKSCGSLLTMMNKSNVQRTTIIGAVNKVLLGLSTHSEPDDNLYTAILASVEIFGWKELSASVKKLLTDSARTKTKKSSYNSRIDLSNFINRVSFILSIERSSKDCEQSESASLISGCISDLTKSDCKDVTNEPSAIKKLDFIIVYSSLMIIISVLNPPLATALSSYRIVCVV